MSIEILKTPILSLFIVLDSRCILLPTFDSTLKKDTFWPTV